MEKIQMTKDQARTMILESGLCSEHAVEIFVRKMNESGYIKKSDLEIIVEIADLSFNQYVGNAKTEISFNVIHKLNNAVQALKKDHPEYK